MNLYIENIITHLCSSNTVIVPQFVFKDFMNYYIFYYFVMYYMKLNVRALSLCNLCNERVLLSNFVHFLKSMSSFFARFV